MFIRLLTELGWIIGTEWQMWAKLMIGIPTGALSLVISVSFVAILDEGRYEMRTLAPGGSER